MAEGFTVESQLVMKSNVPEILAQMLRGFTELNEMIKGAASGIGKFSEEMASLSGSRRGVATLVEAMEKLKGVRLNPGLLTDVRELATAQATLAASARETATAYKEIAANARRAHAGAGGGGGRNGGGSGGGGGAGSGGAGGAGGIGEDRANAVWENANRDQIYNRQRALAEHENNDRNIIARRQQQEATRANRASHHANVSMVDAGIGLGMGGEAGVGFFEKSIEAQLEVAKLMAGFQQNITIKPTDLATIKAKAEALVRSVPGSTIADNLHVIGDAFTVTGNLQEALGGAEPLARLNLLFSSLPGAKGHDQAFKAAQAAEVMQRFYNPTTHEVDVKSLNQQINAMAQVTAGTGGRVSPDMYLAFAKQARLGGMVANDQFLYRDLPAMLITLGGSRTGTGEAATFAQFITGTMTKAGAQALKDAGLLDATAQWKGGRVGDMAHHFRNQGAFMENPTQWMRDNLLGPNGVLAQRHIDPNDRKAVAQFLSSWNGRATGLGFMSEQAIGMAGIDKEAGKIGNTAADPLAVVLANDPNAQIRAFKAATNELMVQFGSAIMGPAIEGIQGLTTALRGITDWARANPNATKDLLLIGAGMTGLATAAGALATVVFLGAPIITGLGALARVISPFGGGGAGATALVTLTGGGGLSALAVGLGGLAAAVVGTVAVMKGFQALNADLGLHPGKGNNGPASPNGNFFMDSFMKGWHSFMAPQEGGGSTRARGGSATSNLHPSAYTSDQHIHVYLDGKEINASVQATRDRDAQRPRTGASSPDGRMSVLYPT